MAEQTLTLKALLKSVVHFSSVASNLTLRKYQEQVAKAIVDSVVRNLGLTFVVIFPRQSGKNELQAQIETYLLLMFHSMDAEFVKASPTWKPQSLNAMRRLERVLLRNAFTMRRWKKESGYIYRLGSARIYFLSAGPTANVVGATANYLLECDEAQDVLISKWDKDFSPMAASTHATRVFWGTAWTSRTLLSRERRAAEAAQLLDGKRRVFILTADDVAKEVPAYGQFVAEQVAKLGRNHPLVKTQFFSEEIDAEGGMFPPQRLALMKGSHPMQVEPDPEKIYAITIDVAGEDEGAADGEDLDAGELKNPARDSTAVTIAEVDLSRLSDPLIGAPVYKIACRYTWTGKKHTELYGVIRSLVETWRARYVAIDATGVGAGLASFLEKAFGLAADKMHPGGKVIPFIFSPKSKSDLGWKFLAVVETGRYQEYANSENLHIFFHQAKYCQASVLEGPGKMMRWGVPDGTRDAEKNDLVHDDVLISGAMVALFDEQEWSVSGAPIIIRGRDPLAEMDLEGF